MERETHTKVGSVALYNSTKKNKQEAIGRTKESQKRKRRKPKTCALGSTDGSSRLGGGGVVGW